MDSKRRASGWAFVMALDMVRNVASCLRFVLLISSVEVNLWSLWRGSDHCTGISIPSYRRYLARNALSLRFLLDKVCFSDSRQLWGKQSWNVMNMVTMHRHREIYTAVIWLLLCCIQAIAFTPPHRGDCRFFLDTADTNEVSYSTVPYDVFWFICLVTSHMQTII